MKVPEVLLSGDHAKIARWRRTEQLRRTWLRRPELLKKAELSAEDSKILAAIEQESGSSGPC
jgi:tRNA (guanine37-N1)-methyltransferase